MKVCILFLSSLFLVACNYESEWVQSCYTNNPDTNKFAVALDKAKIGYVHEKERLCISANDVNREEVEMIALDVFGALPSGNRYIVWPRDMWVSIDGKKHKLDEEGRILKRLKEEKIEVEYIRYYGKNFMAWSESDNECMNKIIKNERCD